MPTTPSISSSSQTTNLRDEPNLQGELGIWITLPQHSIKFPTPEEVHVSPNLDVEVNLKGVPLGKVKVLEAGLKAYTKEQREMTTEREIQLRRFAEET
jgi:hypothetical protein